ncbi:MAG: hypothetical protein Phog2KO_03200 [Phototrophicaceae bacterium]
MSASQAKPSNTKVYEKSTVMNTTVEKMMAFHESTEAFSKLVPPPMIAQIRDDARTSITDGDLKFTLWLGPIPIKWHARHQEGPTESSFADLMIEGPMQYWRHEHIFEPVDTGVKLIDRVTIAHKDGVQGLLTRLMFDGLPLKFLFFYRHLRTKWTVEA